MKIVSIQNTKYFRFVCDFVRMNVTIDEWICHPKTMLILSWFLFISNLRCRSFTHWLFPIGSWFAVHKCQFRNQKLISSRKWVSIESKPKCVRRKIAKKFIHLILFNQTAKAISYHLSIWWTLSSVSQLIDIICVEMRARE